jgi:hypothetical protein
MKLITTAQSILAMLMGAQFAMAEPKTGFRAFPPFIDHPKKAEHLTQAAFTNLNSTKMQDAPSSCPGHIGTTVWYSGTNGYVIQVKLEGKPDVYARSICTFTPTLGMDRIDGEFAQDVEEYLLQKQLGFKSTRLVIFDGKESLPIEEYLRERGFIKK